MTILTNLFGESPFGALEAHGEKVYACAGLLAEHFEHVLGGDLEGVARTLKRISDLESEADEIRNRVHEMLASKVLMPMRRDELFDILEQQDSIADRAEDIAATLSYREMTLPAELADEVGGYLGLVLKNCTLAAGIMSKLDLLVESSFRGRDAATVMRLITELARRDDAVKPRQIELTRKLLAAGDAVGPVESMLWVKALEQLGALSKRADRVGDGIRMTLEIKPPK